MTYIQSLNAEWAELNSSPIAAETLEQWRTTCAELAGVEQLNDALAAIARVGDPCLRFLLTRQAAGDELAGRTVLQSMLGRCVQMAQKARRRPGLDLAELVDHMVTRMWMCIASYPVNSRPDSIAPNLALDTLKRTRQDLGLDKRVREYATDPTVILLASDTPLDDDSTQSALEVLQTAADRGLISRETHAILVAVYGPEARPQQVVAQEFGVSHAAVRTRCSKAVARLRDMAPALVA